jgi:hypothetical protein
MRKFQPKVLVSNSSGEYQDGISVEDDWEDFLSVIWISNVRLGWGCNRRIRASLNHKPTSALPRDL